MATDALLVVQPSVTKTATFTGAAVTLPTGTPKRGDRIRVIYSAATNASGSNSVVFELFVSKDGGSNFYSEFKADPIALSTTAQSGVLSIPLNAQPTSVANGIQFQLVSTFSGAGSTPTITYGAEFQLN